MIGLCLLLHHIFQIHRSICKYSEMCFLYMDYSEMCDIHGLYGELSYLDKIGDSMWIKRTQYKSDSTFKINE